MSIESALNSIRTTESEVYKDNGIHPQLAKLLTALNKGAFYITIEEERVLAEDRYGNEYKLYKNWKGKPCMPTVVYATDVTGKVSKINMKDFPDMIKTLLV